MRVPLRVHHQAGEVGELHHVIVQLLVERVVRAGLVALEREHRTDGHRGHREEREHVHHQVPAQDERAAFGEVHVHEEIRPRAVVAQVHALRILVQRAVAHQRQRAPHHGLGHELAPGEGEGRAVLLAEAPHRGRAEHEGQREAQREHGEDRHEGKETHHLAHRAVGSCAGIAASGRREAGAGRGSRATTSVGATTRAPPSPIEPEGTRRPIPFLSGPGEEATSHVA